MLILVNSLENNGEQGTDDKDVMAIMDWKNGVEKGKGEQEPCSAKL